MIKVLHLGFCTIIQVRVLVDIISLDVPFSGVYTLKEIISTNTLT